MFHIDIVTSIHLLAQLTSLALAISTNQFFYQKKKQGNEYETVPNNQIEA